MSFFTSGFSGLLNNRRKKKASPPKEDVEEKKKVSDKKDEGRWDMLTDAYGRTYWQHSVTGEWSYGVGGGLISPVATINPSPIGYHGQVFTPSPVFAVAPPKKEKKDDNEKKGTGWWKTMYDDDGERYWKHTVSKKTTYKDPYY